MSLFAAVSARMFGRLGVISLSLPRTGNHFSRRSPNRQPDGWLERVLSRSDERGQAIIGDIDCSRGDVRADEIAAMEQRGDPG